MSEIKKGAGLGMGLVIGVVVMVGVLAISPFVCCAGFGAAGAGAAEEARQEREAEVAARPVVDAEPSAIVKAFQDNEVAAGREYAGKRVRITGVVDRITEYGVDMKAPKSGNMFWDLSVYGLDDDRLATLSKGDELTVVCAEVEKSFAGARASGCE